MKRLQTFCLAIGLLWLAMGCHRSPKYPGQQLCQAAKNGDLAQVRLLLERGVDVDARDADGNTALHRASSKDGHAVARFLLAKGADVNAGLGKYTPLCTAVCVDSREIVEFLLSKGADINAGNGPVTPLHEAARGRDINLVEFLIARGADVNAGIETGKTPLFRAIYSPTGDNDDVAELLIAKGTNVDTQATEDEIMPRRHRGTSEARSAVDTRRTDAKALLWHAIERPRPRIVRVLIEAGAGIDIPDTKYGTPLCAAAKWGDVGLVKLLIAKGADVNGVNKYKETPLHEAVLCGSKEVAEVLTAHGADVNAKTREGQTPLDFAERMKPPMPDLVDFLRKAGGQEGKMHPK